MTFDMSTSDVISHGSVSYIDSKEISHLGGGGGTSTSGWDPETSKRINAILDKGTAAWDDGDLSKVVGFNDTQIAAQTQGLADATLLREQASGAFGDSQAFREGQTALGLSNFGGNATGGRARMQQGAIGANATAQFQDRNNQLLSQATNLEAGIGSGQQQQSQNEADSTLKGLNAISGLVSGLGTKQTTTAGGK